MPDRIKLSDFDIHPHLRARMLQRGVTKKEIEEVLGKGKEAKDAKPGTYGKALVFPYNNYWEEKSCYENRLYSVRPELVEGSLSKGRSWFDKPVLSEAEGLTTNGVGTSIFIVRGANNWHGRLRAKGNHSVL